MLTSLTSPSLDRVRRLFHTPRNFGGTARWQSSPRRTTTLNGDSKVVTVVGLNFVGDALRDALDPRLKT